MVNEDIIRQLLKNDVVLQKRLTDLIVSINSLTRRVDNLVGLFEEASKNVTSLGENEEIKPLLQKLDSLSDQNRTIAKGLVLLEQYIRDKHGRISPNFRPKSLSKL